MQLTPTPTTDFATMPRAAAPTAAASAYAGYQIIRRNGAVVGFEPNKIAVALMKAFLAVHGTQGAASASVRETVDLLTETVVHGLLRSRPGGGTFHIEDVQDQVELGLMRGGHHEVARAYVLYRERRAQERAKQGAAGGEDVGERRGHRGTATTAAQSPALTRPGKWRAASRPERRARSSAGARPVRAAGWMRARRSPASTGAPRSSMGSIRPGSR